MTKSPRRTVTKRLVGIDLGTSFSSICWLDETFEARPIENKEGDYKTPSAVYFLEDGAGAAVGRIALDLGPEHPDRFVAHAKRSMGDPARVWEVDGILYSPVDIAAFVLRKLLHDAEPRIGPVTEAVITVPAHFNSLERQRTIEAGRQAGLDTVHLLNEPVATALTFALGTGGREMLYFHDKATVLIYDLGGGTFDLSLVRFDQTQLRVLASSGELRLGGLDWDEVLVRQYTRSFKIEHGVDLHEPVHSRALLQLWQNVEAAKRRLSDPNIHKAPVRFQYDRRETECEIVRADFDRDTRHLVERTRVLTEDLANMAGVTWSEVNKIIPVGGSTRMPMIDRLIERFVNRGIERYTLNPDLAVATGAALYAGLLQSDDTGQFLMEHPRACARVGFNTQVVNSKSLAILCASRHDQVVPHVLIPRNTPLPATAHVKVSTHRPGQTTASLRIVECDDATGRSQALLCNCRLSDLPPDLPQGSLFDIDVSYDTQGLLQLVAKHRATGRLASISAIHEVAGAVPEPPAVPPVVRAQPR